MKLAIVGSLVKPINVHSLGGCEMWTANFVFEESQRNHHIDLYGIFGSITGKNIVLHSLLDKPAGEIAKKYRINATIEEVRKIKSHIIDETYARAASEIKKDQDSFDFIIDSSAYLNFTDMISSIYKPALVIMHFPVDFGLRSYIEKNKVAPNLFFIFPSHYQLKQADFIPESQKFLIHHGIDIEAFNTIQNSKNDYVCWIGRVDPHTPKGLDEFIQVIEQTHKRAKISAFIQNKDYFHKVIVPKLSKLVDFSTEILNSKDKRLFFANARLFLFPIQWEEPFGLVMIESMACGTPVVAYARGSVPEVVKDGVTGFIVNSSDQDIRGDFIIKKTGLAGLKEAVERIYAMPETEYRQMRINSRKHVEDNFTVEKMVDGYEKVYREIINAK